jgi:hypothetical protein
VLAFGLTYIHYIESATNRSKQMNTTEKQAHEFATAKAMAYRAKFTRPVSARAVDGVYCHAFGMFMRNHRPS